MLEKIKASQNERLKIILQKQKSNDLPDIFLILKKLSPNSVILLFVLLASDELHQGYVNVSKNKLQLATKWSIRHIDCLLNELEKKSMIVVKRNGNMKPNTYRFNYHVIFN